MSRIALIALATLVTLAAVAGPAAAAKTFVLEGTMDETTHEYWFQLEGQTAKNPTLEVAAGEAVTITLKSVKQAHNVHVGAPVNKQTDVLAEAQSATLSFTVPAGATGTIDYWCDPHKGLGMAGKMQVAGASTGGETKGTPALGAALALVGVGVVAIAMRRRA